MPAVSIRYNYFKDIAALYRGGAADKSCLRRVASPRGPSPPALTIKHRRRVEQVTHSIDYRNTIRFYWLIPGVELEDSPV